MIDSLSANTALRLNVERLLGSNHLTVLLMTSHQQRMKEARMIKDYDYDTYQRTTRRRTSKKVESLTQRRAGKYQIHSFNKAKTKPIAYPGLTILASPFLIDEKNTGRLKHIQNSLQNNVLGFAPVAPSSFHMTIADLICGDNYVQLSKLPGNDDYFKRVVKELLKNASLRSKGDPVQACIVGIGSFPGVVIALVDFKTEDDYRKIIDLRNQIYKDQLRIDFGVKRKFPFQGHITLGYLETAPPKGLDNALSFIRSKEDFNDWEFEINKVGLYSFRNISEYRLESDPYAI